MIQFNIFSFLQGVTHILSGTFFIWHEVVHVIKNYIQAINTKINQISGTESKVATVTMYNGIKDLVVGSEVLIQNVSETTFNGRFAVTEVLLVNDVAIRFKYVLPSIPEVKQPEIKGTEQVTFTVEGDVGTGNAYYYEYYDANSYILFLRVR